jgi:hypothetical protein
MADSDIELMRGPSCQEGYVPNEWSDLIISQEGIDFDILLTEWRWLIDESYTPLLLTALGDLLLGTENGSIGIE